MTIDGQAVRETDVSTYCTTTQAIEITRFEFDKTTAGRGSAEVRLEPAQDAAERVGAIGWLASAHEGV